MALFQKTRAFVRDLRENQTVDEVYLVCSKDLRRVGSSKGPFLALELCDASGCVQARVWDNAEVLQAAVTVGGFVRVVGKVSLYNGQRQINVTDLEAVPEEQVNLADFQPTSIQDPEQMEQRLRNLIAAIACPHLRALNESFFTDPEFWALFRRAPAAKTIHHATLGGLLEHTLAVAEICLDVAGRYRSLPGDKAAPRLDTDLLVTGALLHDVGKTKELSWTRQFDYTVEGRLVGHIVLGAEMVTERAGRLPGFPAETLLELRHMVLSHHGQYEWGSPKRPKTLEAMILHCVDDLTAKVDTIQEHFRSESDRDAGSPFTYHRTLDRFLYRGGSRGGEGGED
ncbi:MAG: HD domain-containing protein [Bacillota bacterium]|jgi:3'-5' exoribonuclease